MANQEIAAGSARQKAWSKVREIIKTKIESPSKSGLDGAEHKRLTCQLEAVGVLWYPMADLDEMTPEEALPLAQEAVREHAPELCDALGIGWPVEIGALITEPRPAAALHEAALAARARTVGTTPDFPTAAALSDEQLELCGFISTLPPFEHLPPDYIAETLSIPPGASRGVALWELHQKITFDLAKRLRDELPPELNAADLAEIERIEAMTTEEVEAELAAAGVSLEPSQRFSLEKMLRMALELREARERLAVAEAKARVAEELFAAGTALIADLDGRGDYDDDRCWCLPPGTGDSGLVCEACQLRAALAAARAAGIGSDDNRVEAGP